MKPLLVAAMTLVGPISIEPVDLPALTLPPTAGAPMGLTLPPTPPEIDKTVWATPGYALTIALADIGTLPPELHPETRYIWVPDRSPEMLAAVSVALNAAVRRSPITVDPTVIADGYFVRVNLRRLAPKDADFERVSQVWDSQAETERYFHVREIAVDDEGNEVVRVVATPNIAEPMALLQQITQSAVPIVRADWFVSDALRSIDGGHYYDWQDIVPGETRLADYLKRYGADEAASLARGTVERVAMARSGISKKPRGVSLFRGDADRPSVGSSSVAITDDVVDDERGPSLAPFRDAVTFQGDGRESLVEDEAGWTDYALWAKQVDEDGSIFYVAVVEVPINIATDDDRPGTARLHAAFSCIRCHGPDAGFHPLKNDFAGMTRHSTDIFDDLSSRESIDQTVSALAAMYAGDLTVPLQRARDALSDAVFLATALGVPAASEAVASVTESYLYKTVDARQACRELGIPVPAGAVASDVLAATIPPIPPDPTGISPIDPVVALLLDDTPVNRVEFEEVYPDLMLLLYPVVLASDESDAAPVETES